MKKNRSSIFKSQQAGVAALFVTIATLLSTVLGLVRNKVMAHYFGASIDTDIYNYGTTIPDMLQQVLIMGVTASSFIPIFSEYLAQKSTDEANKMASSFLNMTMVFFAGLCVLTGIFMPQITDVWLKPGLPEDQKNGIVLIARVFLATQVAFALSKIYSGILQTHKHFIAYALALLVYNPSIILGMILFHEDYGIYSAAYGALIGGCLVVLVNWIDIRGTDYRYSFDWNWRDQGAKQIYLLAIPNILNMALLQLVFLVYSKISINMPEGSYSAFKYAFDFESFPVSIFGISFVTAIFPFLAENASKKNFVNYNYNVQNSIRQILYLTLPAGVGMAVLSNEIIGLVLGGGKFGIEQTNLTASILFFFAMVVPLESLWYLFARAFYAIKDTWTPFWFRLIGTAVNLSISYIFSQTMGPTAFSLGLLIAFSIQIILFVVGLKRKVPEFELRKPLMDAAKLLACSLLMAIAVMMVNYVLTNTEWMLSKSLRAQYLTRAGVGITIGVVVYLGLTVVFKCADFSVINRVLNRILKRT
ncbi:murein biosynthesis integral membrane protein MurJ [bacterium]|nr:murein biosynthesis integral membrane protein MurJ [bacterium]